jgi:hypothetical protein
LGCGALGIGSPAANLAAHPQATWAAPRFPDS